MNARFGNRGVFILGGLFLIPFLLYGAGIASFTLLIASLILLVFFVLITINFEIGFLALIFFRSSLDYIKTFGSLNLAAIVSLALIVLSFFYVLYRRTNILQFEDSKPFVLFLGVCGISILYSPDQMTSTADWLRLVSVFSVYILTRLIFVSEAKIRMALTALLLSALVPVCLAYYQLATGEGTVMDGEQARIVGTFLHPNAFASYLLIILIFCAAQYLEGIHFINRPFLAVFMFFTFVIFLFTLSRGAWIVFVLAMGLMGILRYKKILSILPVLLVVATLTVPAVRERIMNIFEPSHYIAGRSAWEWRLDTWEEISPLIQEKPVLGHGLSTVEAEFGLLTHNDYLRLLAEVGVLGFLAYLMLAFSSLRKTWEDYKKSSSPIVQSLQIGVVTMIAVFLVRQFADNTIRNTVVMIYFWVFIALVRNLSHLHLNQNPHVYGHSKSISR